MIRTVKVLFCDNEHGTGNVTFPRLDEIDDQYAINPITVVELRRRARAAGWSRLRRGGDYCNDCTAIDKESADG